MILYETAAASRKSKHWTGNFKAIISEKRAGDVRCFRHHLKSMMIYLLIFLKFQGC